MLIVLGAIAVLLAAVLWWYLHRDPERPDTGFDGYVSPASGIVTDIVAVAGNAQHIPKGTHGITALLDDFPQGETIVLIMMKPWHIHTQRAPVAARVEAVHHQPGQKLNAVFGDYRKATVENEHVAYTLGGSRPCKVYAIAGLLARRIVPIAQEGQSLRQGQRLSKIRFGSQVAIVLPRTESILVEVGQTVVDGITPLAR